MRSKLRIARTSTEFEYVFDLSSRTMVVKVVLEVVLVVKVLVVKVLVEALENLLTNLLLGRGLVNRLKGSTTQTSGLLTTWSSNWLTIPAS